MFNPEQINSIPESPHRDMRPEVPDVLANKGDKRQESQEPKSVAVGDTVSAMTPQGIDHECVVDTIKGGTCSIKDSWGKIIPMDARMLSAYQTRPDVMESRERFLAKSLISPGRELTIRNGDTITKYKIRDVMPGGGNNLVLQEIGPYGEEKSITSFSREDVINNLVEAVPSPDARYEARDTVMIYSSSLGKPVAWEVVGPAKTPDSDYHVKRMGDDGQQLGRDVAASEIMGMI